MHCTLTFLQGICFFTTHELNELEFHATIHIVIQACSPEKQKRKEGKNNVQGNDQKETAAAGG